MARIGTLAAAGLAALLGAGSATAQVQEVYIGQVILMGTGFCPRGTAEANGQLLPISQYSALFSLYGTTYGGDGRSTFGLPDLRGRSVVGAGDGPGRTPMPQGATGGREEAVLSVGELPSHVHGVTAQEMVVPTPGSSPSPVGNVQALSSSAQIYAPLPGGTATAAAPGSIQVTEQPVGGNMPVALRDPFQALRYCIAMTGIFPSRS
ncbi:phage tail protein [Poseidonocella sp. HB161398]|uniref:phage tail protein n=1 Tax=Poseidonocella sp. HB161398 TaxID=2320855 RepID=UPI001109EFB2|nr:tail fiber protein [Poseidonocella sp. HB161398]